MGSTGEPDRKRRHISSFSSAAVAAPAMKGLSSPRPEDRKLDAAVLQFQNQKLVQQLEAQRVECSVLENKFEQKKEKHKNYEETLVAVENSWEKLVDDLGALSVCSKELPDVAREEFLSRLLQSGATEYSSESAGASQMETDNRTIQDRIGSILQNVIFDMNGLWHVNNQLSHALSQLSRQAGPTSQLKEKVPGWQIKVKDLHSAFDDLHIKHRSLANEVQVQRDSRAKYKAELNLLEGELDRSYTELHECKTQLAALKALKDTGKGTPFLFPSFGANHSTGDKLRDKDKDFHDLQSANKELTDKVSDQLVEIRKLHEKRLEDLKRLSILQNTLTDLNSISLSEAFISLNNLLEKSKSEMNRYQMSLEELQVEKDNYVWREKEIMLKLDLADISKGTRAVVESRITNLEKYFKNVVDEKTSLERKLEEASNVPGRHKIIGHFKALVSSLPKDMNNIQSQMSGYKEDSYEIHSLRAKVRSLENISARKESLFEVLSNRSSCQVSEIQKLQAKVQDLKRSGEESKLFLDMYKHECTDSHDVLECKDMEYRAWTYVHNLQSSLDEHNLELRVKVANEAEASAQQRLAASEAEIADLRQKLESSERDLLRLSGLLESKRDEGESYLSEIESIGQAYEDVQNKNQLLMQEVTDRDDYNIKLAVEAVKTRHVQDTLRMEIQTASWEMQQSKAAVDECSQKNMILDDQLKIWSEQVAKVSADSWQSSVSLENTKRRLVDVQRESQQLRKTLGDMQSNIDISRNEVSELQIELEKERFNKKRVEEHLEMLTRETIRLRADTEGSSVLGKLKQELREYRGIMKCGICNDRQKEVVIAKCYHLFCHPCVRKTLESRHRKCPTCASSFGPNDVKPIYI